MKYSILAKFIAILLCVLSLMTCAVGAGCILTNETFGLYDMSMDAWIKDYLYKRQTGLAQDIAEMYAAEHLGECSQDVLQTLDGYFYFYGYAAAARDWSIAIYEDGAPLLEEKAPEDSMEFSYTVYSQYPTPWKEGDATDYLYRSTLSVYNSHSGKDYDVDVAYYPGPTYIVVISVHPSALDCFMVNFMTLMYNMRNHAIAIIAAGLLAFAALLVYLCSVAGRHPNCDESYPVAFNRIPLDLYLAAVAALEIFLGHILLDFYNDFRHYSDYLYYYDINWAHVSTGLLILFAMSLALVVFIFAFAAQMKTKGGLWWRKTVTFFLFSRCWRFLKWISRGIAAVFNMLPLVWQWIGIAVLMILIPPACYLFYMVAWDFFWNQFWVFLLFATLIGDMLLLGWWAWYMGQIRKGVAIMRRGGLDHQIPTRFMFGKFREFAESLNSMAEASRLAAEQQLRSERMKTELITNVSHDIKTPLTSIINYVDLLKKPHTDMEEAQYLEVLDRQSQKLKKLIVDLMDMSKASTGNMSMELGRMDAVEAVNQALGEFSDKLALAGLQPLFRCSQDPVIIWADGRLLWRVLNNLLGNAVKYAMPGTRMYVDLTTAENHAVLSIKNISRDELNVDAAELLERCVRGDASRNTEGSGLGLNIAKSLVELQGGQMDLTVDGDLFKVTIVMPLCNN